MARIPSRFAWLLAAPLALAACRDRDGDGWRDEADNCPGAANANQVDADADGAGDTLRRRRRPASAPIGVQ